MLGMLRCCTNRITIFVQTKIVSRKYMTISEKMEILLKQRDHVSRNYKLIYRDKNHTFVGFAYHTMNFLSYMTLATVVYMWYNDVPMKRNGKQLSLSDSYVESIIIGIGLISIFYTSFWIRQRFVLRVYFNDKTQSYKVIFIGRAPFTNEFREYPAKSLTFASPQDSAFPWRNSIFKVNNRKMYLFEDNFRTHSDLLQLLKPGEMFKPDAE